MSLSIQTLMYGRPAYSTLQYLIKIAYFTFGIG